MSNISTDALREVLQSLVKCDLQVEPKRLLIEMVMEALAAREAGAVVRNATMKAPPVWQSAEIELITAYLQGKAANSWQHADEMVTHLVHALHRDAHDLRAKAIELGFGRGVDYRMAKLDVAKTEEA